MNRRADADVALKAADCAAEISGRSIPAQCDLAGKTALVAGAFGGLGRHFAMTLAAAGAKVALAARRIEQAVAIAAEIENNGSASFAVSMDVTNETSVEHALAETAERLGVPGGVGPRQSTFVVG